MHRNTGKDFVDKRPAIQGGGTDRVSQCELSNEDLDEFIRKDNNEDDVTVQIALNHKAPAEISKLQGILMDEIMACVLVNQSV